MLIEVVVVLIVLLLAAVVGFYFFFASRYNREVPDNFWSSKSVDFNSFQSQRIKTNNIELNVYEAGPKDGELVVLLHGFPETAILSWHNQIHPLAEKGYHVIAPDQRGYNTSDKPAGIDSYIVDQLVLDIVGLLDHFKAEKAYIVGHDWGAIVAWLVAIMYPNRVKKLAILNVPHPDVFKQYLYSHVSQLKKSWYIFFFQIPIIPEYFLSKDNFKVMKMLLAGTSNRGSTFPKDSIPKYVEAWSQKGAFTGMLNWYRAMIQKTKNQPTPRRVYVPVLIIWGERDRALEVGFVEPSAQLCDMVQVVKFPDATHWVQHDKVNEVNEHLLKFF